MFFFYIIEEVIMIVTISQKTNKPVKKCDHSPYTQIVINFFINFFFTKYKNEQEKRKFGDKKNHKK